MSCHSAVEIILYPSVPAARLNVLSVYAILNFRWSPEWTCRQQTCCFRGHKRQKELCLLCRAALLWIFSCGLSEKEHYWRLWAQDYLSISKGKKSGMTGQVAFQGNYWEALYHKEKTALLGITVASCAPTSVDSFKWDESLGIQKCSHILCIYIVHT